MLIEQMWIITLIALWTAGKMYQKENEVTRKVRCILELAAIFGIIACIAIIFPKFSWLNFLKLLLFILGCLEVIYKEFCEERKEAVWIELSLAVVAMTIGLHYFISLVTQYYWGC